MAAVGALAGLAAPSLPTHYFPHLVKRSAEPDHSTATGAEEVSPAARSPILRQGHVKQAASDGSAYSARYALSRQRAKRQALEKKIYAARKARKAAAAHEAADVGPEKGREHVAAERGPEHVRAVSRTTKVIFAHRTAKAVTRENAGEQDVGDHVEKDHVEKDHVEKDHVEKDHVEKDRDGTIARLRASLREKTGGYYWQRRTRRRFTPAVEEGGKPKLIGWETVLVEGGGRPLKPGKQETLTRALKLEEISKPIEGAHHGTMADREYAEEPREEHAHLRQRRHGDESHHGRSHDGELGHRREHKHEPEHGHGHGHGHVREHKREHESEHGHGHGDERDHQHEHEHKREHAHGLEHDQTRDPAADALDNEEEADVQAELYTGGVANDSEFSSSSRKDEKDQYEDQHGSQKYDDAEPEPERGDRKSEDHGEESHPRSVRSRRHDEHEHEQEQEHSHGTRKHRHQRSEDSKVRD